jgi:hypothetical protein
LFVYEKAHIKINEALTDRRKMPIREEEGESGDGE